MKRHSALILALVTLASVTVGMAAIAACSTPDLSGPVESNEVFTTDPNFPGAYKSLKDPEGCSMSGPVLQVYPKRMYRRPDQAMAKTTDSFQVYWSICNRGDTPSTATPGAYHLVATNTQTNAQTLTPLDLPAVGRCECIIGQHNFQNELTASTYRFELDDGFSDTPAVNELLTAP